MVQNEPFVADLDTPLLERVLLRLRSPARPTGRVSLTLEPRFSAAPVPERARSAVAATTPIILTLCKGTRRENLNGGTRQSVRVECVVFLGLGEFFFP